MKDKMYAHELISIVTGTVKLRIACRLLGAASLLSQSLSGHKHFTDIDSFQQNNTFHNDFLKLN